VSTGNAVRPLEDLAFTRATITSSHSVSLSYKSLLVRIPIDLELERNFESVIIAPQSIETTLFLRDAMSQMPTEITRDAQNGLSITWRDGTTSQISTELLRRECPCAACKEQRGDTSHSKPLTTKKRGLTVIQNTIEEELDLKEIWVVGQYALGMRWGDGHDSGIYPFGLLFELGKRT